MNQVCVCVNFDAALRMVLPQVKSFGFVVVASAHSQNSQNMRS